MKQEKVFKQDKHIQNIKLREEIQVEIQVAFIWFITGFVVCFALFVLAGKVF